MHSSLSLHGRPRFRAHRNEDHTCTDIHVGLISVDPSLQLGSEHQRMARSVAHSASAVAALRFQDDGRDAEDRAVNSIVLPKLAFVARRTPLDASTFILCSVASITTFGRQCLTCYNDGGRRHGVSLAVSHLPRKGRRVRRAECATGSLGGSGPHSTWRWAKSWHGVARRHTTALLGKRLSVSAHLERHSGVTAHIVAGASQSYDTAVTRRGVRWDAKEWTALCG